jgi:hypothetical protein
VLAVDVVVEADYVLSVEQRWVTWNNGLDHFLDNAVQFLALLLAHGDRKLWYCSLLDALVCKSESWPKVLSSLDGLLLGHLPFFDRWWESWKHHRYYAGNSHMVNDSGRSHPGRSQLGLGPRVATQFALRVNRTDQDWCTLSRLLHGRRLFGYQEAKFAIVAMRATAASKLG